MSKIFVAGHKGLLGSAIVSALRNEGCDNIITASKDELDLTNFNAVDAFFGAHKLDVVFLCAGKVGGIISNKTYPADYLRINLAIQYAVFEAAHKYNAKHILFYGSSCTYPKLCPQPMVETDWLGGHIEGTSMGYAGAKIAGMIACKSYNTQYGYNKFICLVPNSIYGPNDNFDLENSHVLSALLRKFYEAKLNGAPKIILWGSGAPRREFIYSLDAAKASVFALQNAHRLENAHYNVGSGEDISIKELAEKIADIAGYEGEIVWDNFKPDGAPRKLLDAKRFLSLGWQKTVDFNDGLRQTYGWFKENYARIS